MMRRFKPGELEAIIEKKRNRLNLDMLKKGRNRLFRKRPRDKEEQNILDKLCVQKWQKDLASGKVKIINDREWYYEFD